MRHEVEAGYTLIDLQQSFILVLIVLLALIFQLVSLKKVEEQAINSPGDVIVQLYWENGSKTDMDLWVEAPGDKPVGYSNKSGTFFNLLRDDLGSSNDITGLNEEVAFSRGLPDGEYTINVHSYSPSGQYPVRAMVKVMVRQGPGQLVEVYHGDHIFNGPNQEWTYVRFKIKGGFTVPGQNFVQKPLREAKS